MMTERGVVRQPAQRKLQREVTLIAGEGRRSRHLRERRQHGTERRGGSEVMPVAAHQCATGAAVQMQDRGHQLRRVRPVRGRPADRRLDIGGQSTRYRP